MRYKYIMQGSGERMKHNEAYSSVVVTETSSLST